MNKNIDRHDSPFFTFRNAHHLTPEEHQRITNRFRTDLSPDDKVVFRSANIDHALAYAPRRYLQEFRRARAGFELVSLDVLGTHRLSETEGLLLLEEHTPRCTTAYVIPVTYLGPSDHFSPVAQLRRALEQDEVLRAIYAAFVAAEPNHPHLRVSNTSGMVIRTNLRFDEGSGNPIVPATARGAARWLEELGIPLPPQARAVLEQAAPSDSDPSTAKADPQEEWQRPRYTTTCTHAAMAVLPTPDARDGLAHLLELLIPHHARALARAIAQGPSRFLWPRLEQAYRNAQADLDPGRVTPLIQALTLLESEAKAREWT